MAFTSWGSYWQFLKKTRHDFRYVRDEEIENFLNEVLRTSEKRKKPLKIGTLLWRSQLGGTTRPVHHEDEEIGEEPCPLPRERMVPLEFTAPEGRVNPKGIPYLYLATDRETAMGEARPWIGSEISVARFKTLKDLVIIDCSMDLSPKTYLYLTVEPCEEKREESVWADINSAFSSPVVPNENESHYVPTQIIAELFKHNGLDGVAYKSMLGEGHNISLFDVKNAELLSCHLHKATTVDFKFEEIANPYFVKKT